MPKHTSFRPLTEDEVKREIMSMKNKNYELDSDHYTDIKGDYHCLPAIHHTHSQHVTHKGRLHHRLKTGHSKTPP